ncbi:hypothetical protein F4604DRAFT_1822849 [Suillus subluteus]|nr:hypothetical protein F4604DRAFT_1822849 [Suillus subluteus]
MRFSSAIVVAVIAALASSISAIPVDAAGATSADKYETIVPAGQVHDKHRIALYYIHLWNVHSSRLRLSTHLTTIIFISPVILRLCLPRHLRERVSGKGALSKLPY